jgi:TetR/AcrR family transcriptional regulator, mexJK operon transcriptional repressor
MGTRIYHSAKQQPAQLQPVSVSQSAPTAPAENADHALLSAALAAAVSDLPRMPQQARSREKRESLVRAAIHIFAEHGYASTTADMIAAAAGVSIGTFYNYFRNKRQILLALVVEQLDDIFGNLRLAQLELSYGNARGHIRAAVAAALRENERSCLRRVWQELMSSEPELIPYQQLIRDYTQQRLIEQIQRARQRGGAWNHLDVEVTALGILALVDALTMRTQREPGEQRIVEGITDMIYRSIYSEDTG